MSSVVVATLAGIMTAILWGTSDWLSAKCTKKLTPIEINFAIQLVAILMVIIIYLFSGIDPMNQEQLIRIGIASFSINLAYVIFVKALSSGLVGIVVPLGNVFPLFTILLTLIFIGTKFSSVQIFAMIGIVVGAVILAYEKNHKKVPLKELHKESILALLAAVVWGIGFFALDPVVDQLSWQTLSIVAEIYSGIFATIFLIIASRRNTISSIKKAASNRLALLTGFIGMSGMIAFYYGSAASGSVLIPAVLAASSPLIASFWGAVFDQEKIGYVKRLGAIIIVICIAILNIY